MALGDLNADGHLDAMFPVAFDTEPNRVCLRDGAGGFACSTFAANEAASVTLALGNLDPSVIFVDSFESGDLSRWGGSVP